MTKKDYVLIADSIIAAEIKYMRKGGHIDLIEYYLIPELQIRLQKDNPRFDDQRFYEYITKGVNDNV